MLLAMAHFSSRWCPGVLALVLGSFAVRIFAASVFATNVFAI